MKKSDLKLMLRKIVREEVAMAIQEVITELKQPTQQKVSQPKSKKKIVEKKEFTKNSILNDVLNETAINDEWKTMSGGTYTSNDMGNVLKNQYGNLMNGKQGVNPDEMKDFIGCFLTGTAAEVTPVSQINENKFEVCKIITDLNESYQSLVRKKDSAA